MNQLQVLKRNATITPDELNVDKPLRVKYGIDPTSASVHLGHTVPLLKLKQFQDFGHQIILIIGDATAEVGDPSGRDETRSGLTKSEVRRNSESYLHQIGKILDLSKTDVRYNSRWFNPMHLLGVNAVLDIMRSVTIQQLTSRHDFAQRIEAGKPVYMAELIYPVMQGWDSVVVNADVEIGGTEQLFNLMMGRHLQATEDMPPQLCLTMPLLIGTDGKQKMGKSLNNFIGISEPPLEQFGKTMSIPDSLMPQWFNLLFDQDQSELIASSPMEAKKLLGFQIAKTYHGEEQAIIAKQEWENQFCHRQDPSLIPTTVVADTSLVSVLVTIGFASSNSDARRLIKQGGVSVDRVKITEPTTKLTIPDNGVVVRVGPKRIMKVMSY